LKQEDLFEQRSNFAVEKVFKIQLNSIKVWKVVNFLYARQNTPVVFSLFMGAMKMALQFFDLKYDFHIFWSQI